VNSKFYIRLQFKVDHIGFGRPKAEAVCDALSSLLFAPPAFPSLFPTVSVEIEFGAFYPYNMTFSGSNFTNFPESCVGLISLGPYGDQGTYKYNKYVGLYSFSTGPVSIFLPCISARPKAGASLASTKGRHCSS